ncbi:hypothetical protein FQN49_001685 [Arthroderma sp. PD_2]|nr:hypothetical protein FQN49_001685 [Arthroderma sp. PD_2]
MKAFAATSKWKKGRRVSAKALGPSVVDITLDMNWYDSWLAQQLENLPSCVRDLNVTGGSPVEKPHLDQLIHAIEDFIKLEEVVTIDGIAKYLGKLEVFESEDDLLPAQKLLIFAVLGWRSMLYQASFNTCSIKEFAVHRDSDQPHSGLVFDTYRVPAHLSNRPLWVLLKAFGNLLPARDPTAPQLASENGKLVSSWMPLYPMETNAYLLNALLRVRIRWVDSLALHLDYDKSTRTLSLFAYPSFCLEMLSSEGAIHSFASVDRSGIDPRANKDGVSHLLLEVLLSYRLLFGQSAKSRKLFRQSFQPPGKAGCRIDSILPLLCTRNQIPFSQSLGMPADKPIYFASQDFPILQERIEIIAKELKDSRPSSLSSLIRDRRDTLQFWTFWLVLIIGGISTVLSLTQVILQAVQLIQS